MQNLSFVYAMTLASSNKTGRNKSKLWKAHDDEFYY